MATLWLVSLLCLQMGFTAYAQAGHEEMFTHLGFPIISGWSCHRAELLGIMCLAPVAAWLKEWLRQRPFHGLGAPHLSQSGR